MRHRTLFIFLLPVLLICAAGNAQAGPNDDSLAAGEYYFDTDPGTGFGYPLTAADGTFDEPFELINQSIILPELISGPHYLFVRLRNVDGVWGIPHRQLLMVTNNNTITTAEYFFDTDPGNGSGLPLMVNDGIIDTYIDATGLGEGLHTMYIRMQDAEGSWGPARQHTFEVAEWTGSGNISVAEYFIDADPGEGNGIPLSPTDGSFGGIEEALSGKLRTNFIGEGDHILYVRALDSNGRWTRPAPSKNLKIFPFLGKLGDLNGDDQIDLKDAILALMVVSGQNPFSLRTDYVSSGVDVDNWQVGMPEAIFVITKMAE